jgi:hypothetical protein
LLSKLSVIAENFKNLRKGQVMIMKRTVRIIGLLTLALAVVCGGFFAFGMTAHAQASSCSVCGGAYENGFCATENCAGAYEPASKTNIEGADFYEIGNAGQLYWFAALVNGGNETVNAVLTADITVNADDLGLIPVSANGTVTETGIARRAWTPIGNTSHYFRGVFDGNGHSISGLYFNDVTQSNVGLIGCGGSSAGTCEIRNLTVKRSFFMGKNSVGAIAGYLDQATVKNCSQTGAVYGMVSAVGGIIGGGNQITLENCVNAGTVKGTGRRTEQVGGVVANLAYGEVKNCRNTGSVTGYSQVGGVLGFIHVSGVTDCMNEGIVVGNATGNSVGGVVGNVNYGSTLEKCVNRGSVSGDITVGGVVGNNKNSMLTSCENTGAVSGTTSVGGLIGYNTNASTSTSAKDCRNTGAVNGEASVGGLVGTNRSASPIELCFNTASVTGTSKVGGVVGENTGDILRCHNTGNVTGMSKVGGVAGENMRGVIACYNTGAVSGESAVGGVVGSNAGQVQQTYNTGDVRGSASVGGVMGMGMSWDSMDNYYLKTDTVNASVGGVDGSDIDRKAKGLSAQAFASGEAAYLLFNQFGQRLSGENADAFPVFRTDDNAVYRFYLICSNGVSVYSNSAENAEKRVEHLDADGDGNCDYCVKGAENEGNVGGSTSNGGNVGGNDTAENVPPALVIGIAAGVLAVITAAGILFVVLRKKKKS